MRAETAPRMPPTSRTPLHATLRTRVMGSATREKSYHGKNRPACLRTVLGLAQQRVALMCGLGPRAPVGVQKEGCVFVPQYLCMGSRSCAHGNAKQNRGGDQGKTKAQENKSNAKAKTTKSKGTKQVPPARPLPGQPQQPRQDPCRDSSPHTNRASHP